GEVFADRPRRVGQRADMDRHVLGLRDQPAVEAADRGREISARIEDLRIGCAQHRFAHLLDDRQEAMLDHRGDDRIDAVVERRDTAIWHWCYSPLKASLPSAYPREAQLPTTRICEEIWGAS